MQGGSRRRRPEASSQPDAVYQFPAAKKKISFRKILPKIDPGTSAALPGSFAQTAYVSGTGSAKAAKMADHLDIATLPLLSLLTPLEAGSAVPESGTTGAGGADSLTADDPLITAVSSLNGGSNSAEQDEDSDFEWPETSDQAMNDNGDSGSLSSSETEGDGTLEASLEITPEDSVEITPEQSVEITPREIGGEVKAEARGVIVGNGTPETDTAGTSASASKTSTSTAPTKTSTEQQSLLFRTTQVKTILTYR